MISRESLAASPSDRRPSLTPAQRHWLFERALVDVRHDDGLVARAQRQCDLARGVSTASITLLRDVDPVVSHGVRTHLDAIAEPAYAFLDAPPALVGAQWDRASSTVERVLAERFGAVAAVEGGARLVATAMLGQPVLVALHDDLVRPSAVEAAVLLRAVAPATVAMVVSDHPIVLDDAAVVGVTTCSAAVGADELGDLLDRVVAWSAS
jgi:hypothetical protein